MSTSGSQNTIKVLFEDNHLLAVYKPPGLLVQGDRTGDRSLLELSKEYIKRKYDKPGNVYLGLAHRLDRPASGVVVLARTSKAAGRLMKQFQNGTPRKVYWALTDGKPLAEGQWIDYITRRGPTSQITDSGHGKRSILTFRRLKYNPPIAWLEVGLHTGRHHQIRVQFASRGFPILGDMRYGSRRKFPARSIGLHARSFSIIHPTRNEELCFTADPEPFWPEEFR